MSDQHMWMAQAFTDGLLADVAAIRGRVAALAHALAGDDLKAEQAGAVAVVGCLDELAEKVRAGLGVPVAAGVVPAGSGSRPEPGQQTVEVVRRMRKNSAGRHRSTP